jgi:RHS repeat-associated protein
MMDTDFVVPGSQELSTARNYNSFDARVGLFGQRWSSGFERTLSFVRPGEVCSASMVSPTACSTSITDVTEIRANRPNGGLVKLTHDSDGIWTDEAGDHTLTTANGEYYLWQQDGKVERYSLSGKPLSVRTEFGTGIDYTYNGFGALSQITHTNGRAISFAISNSKVTSITQPGGSVLQYTYNSSGMLSTVTAPGQLSTRTYHYETHMPWALTGYSLNGVRYGRYDYYTDGRVRESGLDGGREKSTFVYAAGRTDVTNAAGQTTQHYVNSIGRTTRIDRPATATCPFGSVSTTYDDNGNPTAAVDAAGNKTTYTYTSAGRLASRVSGIANNGDTSNQSIQSIEWNDSGTKVLSVAQYGSSLSNALRETLYTYYDASDAAGRAYRLQSMSLVDKTATPNVSRAVLFDYTFHVNGEIATRTIDGPLPGSGDTTTYAYDAQGNLTSVVDAAGNQTVYSNFTDPGRAQTIVDPNGGVSSYTFDSLGRVSSAALTAAGTAVTGSYTYDGAGKMLSATDSSGRITDYRYDVSGNLIQRAADSANPIGPTARDVLNTNYDNLNKLVSRIALQSYMKLVVVGYQGGEPVEEWVSTTSRYRKQTWLYDSGGQLAASIGETGQNLRYGYDANKNLRSVTDSAGRLSTRSFNTRNRPTSVILSDGSTVSVTYDGFGRTAAVVSPNGAEERYFYNGFGEITRIESSDRGVTIFEYDAAGNLLNALKGDGSQVTITRDPLGRVTRVDASSGPTSQPAQVVTNLYSYDTCAYGKGRLCSVSDATGGTSYSYTQGGNVLAQSSIIDGVTFTTSYAYDLLGRVTQVDHQGGASIRYTYAADSRIRTIEANVTGAWQPVVSNAGYQPFGGPLIGFTFGNGTSRSIDYDADGRIKKIYGNAFTPQSLQYTYSVDNNITSISNTKNTAAIQTYVYDARGRLSSNNAVGYGQVSWTYDSVGNRLTQTTAAQSQTYSLAADSNKLLSTAGQTPRSFQYDSAGNLRRETVQGANNDREYNGFGALIGFTRDAPYSISGVFGPSHNAAAGVWQYGIDGLQRRAFRKRISPAPLITRFLHDAAGNLVAESNLQNGAITTQYIWLDGQLVGFIRGAQVYYVHGDHLGRPEVVTNGSKAIVWRANNLGPDRVVTVSTIGDLNIGFPGHYFDAERNTWHNSVREFDSSIGRYMSADPSGLRGGLGLYSYAAGNPVNYSDPTGLSPLTIGAIAACVTRAGVGYVGGDAFSGSLRSFARMQAETRRQRECEQQAADEQGSPSVLGQSNPLAVYAFSTAANASNAFAETASRGLWTVVSLGSMASVDLTAFCGLAGFMGGLFYGDGSTSYAIESTLLEFTQGLNGEENQ